MKEIPLTRGFVALVDDDDYEWLSQWKWYLGSRNYAIRSTQVGGVRTRIMMHRVIANTPQDMNCDHINNDPLDNRRTNLRNCTPKENHRNRKQSKGGSAYKGVYWEKRVGRWRADIRVDYKLNFLGYHATEIDAAHAYDRAAREYFGEFAQLNFPA